MLWRGCHGAGRAGAAVCYVRQSNRRSSAEEGGEGGQGTVDHVSATLGGAQEMFSQPIIIEMQTPSAPPPPASRTSPRPPQEPSPPLRAGNTTSTNPGSGEVLQGAQDASSTNLCDSLPSTVTGECVVCLNAPKVMALVPCGHQCACAQCSPLLEGKPCPICRSMVQGTMRIFR